MKFFRKHKTILSPEQRIQRRREWLIALLSGILIGASFPPLPLPFIIFFALVPFYFNLESREGLTERNRITYLTAFIFTIITLYWVGSWTKEADPFLMISGVLLMFVNPALYLIPTTLYHFAIKIFNKKTALFLFPLFWVTFEYLYSITDLRFPWLTLANSLPKFNLFIQIADFIGAYGLSLLVLYINVFLYLSIKELVKTKKIHVKYFVAVIVLFVLPLIYGSIRISTLKLPKENIKVGLVQPDLNPWDKWQAGDLNEQLDLYLELSRSAVRKNAKLILWPESALPVYLLSGNYFEQVERIHQFADSNDVFILTGMPDATFFFNKEESPSDAKVSKISGVHYVSYNSILLFSPQSRNIQKYGKIKLVPFGEKVPFVEELPFLGDFIKWQVGISSWNVGREQVVFDMIEGVEFKTAGVICIESIYPDFVASFVQKGANLIAVVTNDSWYGYSSGPFQHKEIATLRAVENRRFVIRAANGGVSCIIDPFGRTIVQSKLFTQDVLIGNAGLNNYLTFYSRYPLIIPWFCSFISIIILLIFIGKKFIHKKIERNEIH